MNRTRIVIAEDHTLVRQGIGALINAITDFEMVGEAANGRDVLKLIRTLLPDVVLMDITMPELNGLDATALLCREHPQIKVIIISMHATEAYVVEALRAGAAGYLLKDAESGELERAIRTVVRGERYLTAAVSQNMIERFLRLDQQASAEGGPKSEVLTTRQREVLQLVAEGRSTREIAERLNLSVKTIESHRAQLMQRLEIFDVAGLTRYALRVGLIDPAA